VSVVLVQHKTRYDDDRWYPTHRHTVYYDEDCKIQVLEEEL
jgi:hypothetical protein